MPDLRVELHLGWDEWVFLGKLNVNLKLPISVYSVDRSVDQRLPVHTLVATYDPYFKIFLIIELVAED